MRRTLARSLAWYISVSAGWLTATTHAAEIIHLTGWDGVAALVKNRGPGLEFFELSARADWRNRQPRAYDVHVVLPDGRSDTRPLRSDEGPGGRLVTAFVPPAAVRNLFPTAVQVRVTVIDRASGVEISNVLTAGIDEFPHPEPDGPVDDPGPFGWGRPLVRGRGQAELLPRPGPDDWRFVRIAATAELPAYFIATTEATNAQVARRLPGYDPRAGRSDDFELERPDQPAVGLTPQRAQAYLRALSLADPAGVAYRLPTRAEWLRAARAGRRSAFWWGDQPEHPGGANFHGPEPALRAEATAPSLPSETEPRFHPNPWGLFHTFGNVDEWATAPAGGFVRLGGNFRTEPRSPLPDGPVTKGDSMGENPYVGLRPAFSLDAETGALLARKALGDDRRLVGLGVAYHPETATATVTGTLPDSNLRRAADRRLGPLWFLAAVVNRIETPTFAPGQLARLGAVAGPVRRITPLGRWFYEVPIEVRWSRPLPVEGSAWWVNVFLPGGTSFAHRMVEGTPGRGNRLTVMIDRARMAAAGLAADAPVSVALSLGAEAAGPGDPRVVSNVVAVYWRLP